MKSTKGGKQSRARRVREQKSKTTRQERGNKSTTSHARRTQKRVPATHICHRCHHKFTPLTMQQVTWQQDEQGQFGYGMWSQARAEHFKRNHIKFPKLVWLCWGCIAAESQPREEIS